MVPFLIRRTSWIPIPLYASLIFLFRYLSADAAYDPDSRRIQNIFDYLAQFSIPNINPQKLKELEECDAEDLPSWILRLFKLPHPQFI